jgi:hypothetical protein
MIRRFEVGHFEFNELGAVVLPRAEGDWKNHRTKWCAALPGEDEVETTPTVDEHLGEPDFCHHWIQDQGELTGLREARPLIITGERDGDLRPTEWSWYRRLDGHDLPEKQLLVPPGAEVSITPEDDVDGLQSILELHVAPLILLVVVLEFIVYWLLVLFATTGVAE